MACRGVLFSLTEDRTERLLTASRLGDEALDDFVEEVEEAWDEDELVELDKSWDAMHRCLSDEMTNFAGGIYPLNRAILGGMRLRDGDDYIVTFVPKGEVVDVAKALAGVTEPWFRDRFFTLRATGFPQDHLNAERWQYTWDNFLDVRAFYQQSAKRSRAVIFTVDQ